MSAGHSTTNEEYDDREYDDRFVPKEEVTLALLFQEVKQLKKAFSGHISDSKDERKECETRLRRIEIAIVVLICTTMTLCIILKFGMPLVGLAPIVEATFEKALACVGQFIGLA